MANYISSINQRIAAAVAAVPNIVLYGPNMNNGTFISGLTKNLKVQEGGHILNVNNCENTLCGVGFGMMLNGVHSVYFVKQLDFMLLGMDHFVNTYNFIRCSRDLSKLGSFTIIQLVCDQGLQGPQSSLDSFGDFCSIARIPCYALTNAADTEYVLKTQLTQPGFRMISFSMKMFKSEFLALPVVRQAEDGSVFQYTEGKDLTIVCFNFALPDGVALAEKFKARGLQADLFSVNYVPELDWAPILSSMGKTKKVVVLDDSKSEHLPAYKLLARGYQSGLNFASAVAVRESIDFGICDDRYVVDDQAIAAQLKLPTP